MHFCTYFDHRYLPRGLALYRSLKRYRPDAVLWVLCLSEQCVSMLKLLRLADLRIVELSELENFDPELLNAKASRTTIEYYFTCSPCFPRYILSSNPDIDRLFYVDSDFYFYSDPESILAEIDQASVAITPHRFTARAVKSHRQFGTYNVGLMMFRNDAGGMRCLSWWRSQCLEWCYDRVDRATGRYADQGYLDHFHRVEASTYPIAHRGVNLAPWNIADSRLTQENGHPYVDGRPLICFHFQGLKQVGEGVFNSNLTPYGARLNSVSRELIYKPYIRELAAVLALLTEAGFVDELDNGIRKSAASSLTTARSLALLALAQAFVFGNLIKS